jgi:LAO/AO transport system kinase
VSVVVLVPGLGDEVQTLKAGIMEIADVFVVNKADREGAERVVAEIESMLSLSAHDGHIPAIVRTVATEDQGVEELLQAVETFRAWAETTGLLARKRRAHLRSQLEDTLRERLLGRMRTRILSPPEVERTVDRLARRQLDPVTAADRLLKKMGLP